MALSISDGYMAVPLCASKRGQTLHGKGSQQDYISVDLDTTIMNRGIVLDRIEFLNATNRPVNLLKFIFELADCILV